MIRVYAHSDPTVLDKALCDIGILIFGTTNQTKYGTAVGNQVRRELARLDLPVEQVAFDFLAIALAIAAADRFVLRADAPDGFGRNILLTIGIADPKPWGCVKSDLECALNFLTGDQWQLEFVNGGKTAPSQKERARLRNRIDLGNVDEVCLFSGGMDSLIGAINRIAEGHVPLLVSRSTRGDGNYQKYLHGQLPKDVPRLLVNDDMRGLDQGEPSTRSRSIVFIALAACGASAISRLRNNKQVRLIIPENGFIALNPPLTTRRVGALSTRTVHPHFIGSLQKVFLDVGIHANIQNPLYFQTKGEALAACGNQGLVKKMISNTVSCGKWKRHWQQCGRCVPCLIRRSALHAAGIADNTATSKKKGYRFDDLTTALHTDRDRADIRAVATAIRKAKVSELKQWVIRSGPLPLDAILRDQHFEVARRGLAEIEAFLTAKGIDA